MEQDKRWSRSPLNVMEPNPLDCDEASRWEVTTLGSLRKNVIHNGGRSQSCRHDANSDWVPP
jgi:hypothetical protein